MKTGGCQCGQVRFQVTGEPINQVFCYCTDCQKRTGGDQWFGIWVPTDNLEFSGELAPAVYTQTSDLGHEVRHHYCPDCGVNLCAHHAAAGFYTVSGPAFDDSAPLAPKLAIFARSAPAWAVLPSDIPVFDTVPPEMGG